MLAAALAAMPSFQVVLPGEDNEAFFRVVVISFFELRHYAKLRLFVYKAH